MNNLIGKIVRVDCTGSNKYLHHAIVEIMDEGELNGKSYYVCKLIHHARINNIEPPRKYKKNDIISIIKIDVVEIVPIIETSNSSDRFCISEYGTDYIRLSSFKNAYKTFTVNRFCYEELVINGIAENHQGILSVVEQSRQMCKHDWYGYDQIHSKCSRCGVMARDD